MNFFTQKHQSPFSKLVKWKTSVLIITPSPTHTPTQNALHVPYCTSIMLKKLPVTQEQLRCACLLGALVIIIRGVFLKLSLHEFFICNFSICIIFQNRCQTWSIYVIKMQMRKFSKHLWQLCQYTITRFEIVTPHTSVDFLFFSFFIFSFPFFFFFF